MSSPAEASIHSVSSSTQPEKVDVNLNGAPVSKNYEKTGSRIDKLVRIHVPISYESWDEVPLKYKDGVWNELLAIANPSKEITRREVWGKAHKKKDGTILDSASSYFDKIAKANETINDSDEEGLPLDEDIISPVFGKDIKGMTRSIGSKISRNQIKTSTIACNKLKKAKGDSKDLKARLENVEGALENLQGLMENQNKTLKTLLDLITKGYTSRENQTSSADFNEGGSSTRQDVVAQLNSLGVSNQNNCEILNIDSDVIATATVCRDSTSILHGKLVPSTQEKLVVSSILLPNERTSKQNHHFATTFDEVGIGGFVCHPKHSIRYL